MVTHPWWNHGRWSYWRFYNWSKGDGALVKLYPSLGYLDYSPNSAELLLFSIVMVVLSGILHTSTAAPLFPFKLGVSMSLSVFIVNVVGWRWVCAIMESSLGSLIPIFSEWGRVVGILERGEFGMVGRQFDWFAGGWGDGPKSEERKNNLERMALWMVSVAIFTACYS